MTYEDIRYSIQNSNENNHIQGFFSQILCGFKGYVEEIGCQCASKCPWKDHWLSLSMKNSLFEPQQFFPVQKAIEEQIKKDLKRTQPNSTTFQRLEYQ